MWRLTPLILTRGIGPYNFFLWRHNPHQSTSPFPGIPPIKSTLGCVMKSKFGKWDVVLWFLDVMVLLTRNCWKISFHRYWSTLFFFFQESVFWQFLAQQDFCQNSFLLIGHIICFRSLQFKCKNTYEYYRLSYIIKETYFIIVSGFSDIYYETKKTKEIPISVTLVMSSLRGFSSWRIFLCGLHRLELPPDLEIYYVWQNAPRHGVAPGHGALLTIFNKIRSQCLLVVFQGQKLENIFHQLTKEIPFSVTLVMSSLGGFLFLAQSPL